MAFTLSVDKTEILIGDTLNFTLDKGSAGAWAEVLFHYVLPNVTHLNSYWTSPLIQFTPTLIGEWEFYYEKDGETSNTVTVTVRNPVYTLELDETDYYTPNGSVTAKATLKCEGSAVSGATISLTGTGSTLTATTNSSGVATFNITGLQDRATITATYNNTITDTATIHYFDNTTLLGSLYLLGDKMATNLESMGVTGFTYLDGLNTLADEILNLPPAMGGIEVVTALSISASPSVVAAGETVTITGVLEADKDDTSQVNVDLEGYLSGATVKIYNESTLLGSAVTNSNGVYSFQYTPSSHGSLTLHAAFEGTNDYDACQSGNVNVSVVDAVPAVLNLTSDKDILSYADEQQTPGSQVATLSAEVLDTLGDPSENVPVQFYKDGVSWGDPVYTNSNGIATKSYTSQGVGDIEFGAECGSLLSETYSIEDCDMYDSCASDKTSNYTFSKIMYSDSSLSRTFSFDSTEQCYESTGTSSGGAGVNYLIKLLDHSSSIKKKITFKAKSSTIGTTPHVYCDCGFVLSNTSTGAGQSVYARANSGTSRLTTQSSFTSWNHTYNGSCSTFADQWVNYELTIDNLNYTFKIIDSSNNTIWEYTNTFNSSLSGKPLGIMVGWANSSILLKDIKIKPL